MKIKSKNISFKTRFKDRIAQALVLLISTFIVSCQSEDLFPTITLIGQWEWVESVSAWSASSPENTGNSRTIEFSLDSIYSQYIDDSLVLRSAYTVQEVVDSSFTSNGSPNHSLVRIKDAHSFAYYMRSDSLFIYQLVLDLPHSLYLRK